MAEYSKEKLFYLKLYKDFFDKHFIKIIEAQDNGDRFAYFLIKLMSESISHNGYLRYDEDTPYNEKMLSAVTNTDIDIVKEALKLFLDMKIIEYTDDQTIFIPRVQELTCSTTEGAERKRQQVEERWNKSGKSSTIVKSIESKDKSIEYDNDKICLVNNNNNSDDDLEENIKIARTPWLDKDDETIDFIKSK